jgi:hypothetical protein
MEGQAQAVPRRAGEAVETREARERRASRREDGEEAARAREEAGGDAAREAAGEDTPGEAAGEDAATSSAARSPAASPRVSALQRAALTFLVRRAWPIRHCCVELGLSSCGVGMAAWAEDASAIKGFENMALP